MTLPPEEPTPASPGQPTTPPPGPLRLRYAAVSDVGRHRKDNQDSGFASERLLVVADGVGGQAFGDVASSTAVHLLRRLDEPLADRGSGDGSEELSALAGAAQRVHDRLAELVEQDDELDGTSTTLTAALFDGRSLALAHIGDSRAYLLRDGALRRLTTDHTFVQSLVDEGRITEEESRVHPHRNIILRAVDGVHDPDPDLFVVGLEAGDRVMLCSDGCSGVLDDTAITGLLGDGPVDFTAVELVRASLDAGSTDNVTVVTAEVVDAAAEDDPESAATGVGPMLVGAAASQPRRGMLSRIPFRGRQSDTGELEPIDDDDVDPEALRYAPQAPRRRRGLRVALVVVVALLVLAGVASGAYSWTQQQYYVSADGPQVAVFRGVQMELPAVSLSEVHEASSLQLDDLTPYNRRLVEEGIVADSLDQARDIVDNLQEETRQQAEDACARARRAERTPTSGRSPAADGGDATISSDEPSGSSTDEADPVGSAASDCPTETGDTPTRTAQASPSPSGGGGG